MLTEESGPLRYVEKRTPHTNSIDDDGTALLLLSRPEDVVVSPKPVKRPTRQWAAWTREEEESFFTALRQVGKNFEKITRRVQSKNKDQVRHYYYRLVRRMNKLLGPGLYLDAKNSKDTNAAMLRWWSLLEKYSCKASKLHLKPRRYKIFVEALEHQLLKDRKKNVKRRSSQGEIFSSSSPTAVTNQNKSSGDDLRAVKIVLADSQNTQKAGQGRGCSTRRNSNMGINRSSNKMESLSAKSTRQRRKNGAVSAAAMKRWERAAMAGVSLVADAAEHLERTAGRKEADPQDELCCAEQNASGPSRQVNLQKDSEIIAVQNFAQASVKLKLQLFPIDENTRKALELDNHNPHLELTLSARKKLSSVLEHLDRKWGSSSIASGELMLFPFNIQRENLWNYQRWTRDSAVSAAEVSAMIGSPVVFRLRYGWINSTELQCGTSETPSKASSKQVLVVQTLSPAAENNKAENIFDHLLRDHQTSERHNNSTKQSVTPAAGELNGTCLHKRPLESCGGSTSRKVGDMVDQQVRQPRGLSDGNRDDSFTNLSVGDLLNEAPQDMDADCVENPAFGSPVCLQEIPFTCDSFDAAIAAHIFSQNKMGFSGFSSHSSSIWDAEETCDAFLFNKRAISSKDASGSTIAAASVSGDWVAGTSSAGSGIDIQEETLAEDIVENDQMKENPSEHHDTENSAKDFSSLTDIYWPDSLGPLELDVPSCKYYGEGMILSDSLSGINRLIASSLDTFQNCSLFGLEDGGGLKSPGVQGGASFAGKISSGDTTGAQSLQV